MLRVEFSVDGVSCKGDEDARKLGLLAKREAEALVPRMKRGVCCSRAVDAMTLVGWWVVRKAMISSKSPQIEVDFW